MPLRAATFNLENLDDRPGPGPSLDERIAIIRPQLLRLRADILCLQEINGQEPDKNNEARNKGLTLRALDALLVETPYADFHRVSTQSVSGGGVRDKHNLVILSRYPIKDHVQIRHHLVPPPKYHPVTATPPFDTPQEIEWDRPFLHAGIDLCELGMGVLHVVNLHLRAPRAAFVRGRKSSSTEWKSVPGWAEGFFLAMVKRAGQALEVRLFIDSILDEEPDAHLIVCGDFNGGLRECPLRIIRGDEEDIGNGHLTWRVLIPLEHSLSESRRFTVIHCGRAQMVDHILVTQPLLAWYRSSEIHNEALGDEYATPATVPGAPESYHAPVTAEFSLPRIKNAPKGNDA